MYPGKETAAHSRVNFREIRAPGYWQMQMRIALNTSVFAVDLLLAPSGQGYFSIDLNFISYDENTVLVKDSTLC